MTEQYTRSQSTMDFVSLVLKTNSYEFGYLIFQNISLRPNMMVLLVLLRFQWMELKLFAEQIMGL